MKAQSQILIAFNLFEKFYKEKISTFAGSAGVGNRWAQIKKMSGAGFPLTTSGSELPATRW